jgi:hypothetical protein
MRARYPRAVDSGRRGGVAPALDAQGTLICAWGGVIKVAQPGQVTTFVP